MPLFDCLHDFLSYDSSFSFRLLYIYHWTLLSWKRDHLPKYYNTNVNAFTIQQCILMSIGGKNG